MTRGVDYDPAVDRKGREVNPGDYVSVPLYPRGTLLGWIVVSDRVHVARRGDNRPMKELPFALEVEDEGGTRYEWEDAGLLLEYADGTKPDRRRAP